MQTQHKNLTNQLSQLHTQEILNGRGGYSPSSTLCCGDRSPPLHAHFSEIGKTEMAKSNLAKLFNGLVNEKDLL